MKYETTTLAIVFLCLSTAAPTPNANGSILPRYNILRSREVPQERSHNRFLDGVRVNLNLDNPAGIIDPVFGLLGDAAAAEGAGTITNLACLHQATADQAFTNAKAIGNVTGMADSLIYAALERNTGKVGQESAACNDAAVNAEIQAVKQHQDPASPDAAATNKAIVLVLAKQLKSIGADPQLALLSGTFAPGDLNDPTGAGNTCDTADDVEGCIFSQDLLVNDATPEEIDAATGGATTDGSGASDSCPAQVTSTTTINAAPTEAPPASVPAASVSTNVATPASGGSNIQTFAGNLGGPPPPPVISSVGDRPFSVNGATFVNLGASLSRSCAIQHNACADAANAGTISASVEDCGVQETECNTAASANV